MGGGDLNLKKSWHPQTLKNIERVWKAEQRHEAERKKIDELQKELREERAREEMTKYAEETGAIKKKDDRLDWMYQGPGGLVSREEYLLGRPIDKQITQQYEEPDSGPSAETGLLPGSIFSPNLSTSTLDLAAKIREDPLFAIRKREEEKKRNILTNPVKMKMIKEMLRQNLEKEKKKEKKKKKKEKRRRSKKHSTSDHDSSCDEEKPRIQHRGTTGSDAADLSRYGLQLPGNKHHHSNGRHGNSFRDKPSRSLVGDRTGRSSPSSKTTDPKAQSACSRPSSQTLRDSVREHRHRKHDTNHSKRLSSEELNRKRQEMMDFARERDEERTANVKRYRGEDQLEKEHDRLRSQQAGFIHNMKLESADSSLEDRVKRNINSLQRTPAALDKNFMKR